MLEKYLREGNLDRAAIAMDVKRRRLKPEEIRQLCNHKAVQEAYIGKIYDDKKPKQYWNQGYLDLLYWAVVAESFNMDYLLYLYEVADFVAKAKYKKIVVAGIIIVLVIVAGVVAFSYILT